MTQRRVIIAGGSGLVGQRLEKVATSAGWKVDILSRRKSPDQNNRYLWDTDKKYISVPLDNYDAIVNLAGAGVMDQAWSASYKSKIISSRVNTAATIGKALELCKHPPMLLNASAIGYYGYRDDHGEHFSEISTPTAGDFLQEVCKDWENAANAAGKHADGLTILRIGIVLSNEGGALPEMLKGFKFGIGSYFSPGSQYYSWIHIDDLCRMMLYIIENNLVGIYNGVAPNPVTSKHMAQAIAQAKYGRKTVLPVPKFVSKLALGERQKMLTGSCWVSAEKIKSQGFSYRYESIESAASDLIS